MFPIVYTFWYTISCICDMNILSLPQKDDAWLVSNVRMQMFDNRDYASIEAYYYEGNPNYTLYGFMFDGMKEQADSFREIFLSIVDF